MLLYCLARSVAGHLSETHDIDIHNTVLYQHFAAVTVVLTVAIVVLFPLAR